MAANSSITLTNLDFDSYKDSLKTYLRQQPLFRDYNFESSNFAVLLDVLAYNTYQNAFYLNMIGNEMFLDTAVLRDSVVSHAKELNYLPRSFRSAEATVGLTITTTDPDKKNITIAKGTPFTSRVGANTYTFTTNENIVLTSQTNVFNGTVTIYEGEVFNDTYVVDYEVERRFIISNKTVDLSSLKVTIIEDNGATVKSYTRATSLFGLKSTSEIFFVQPYIGETYEVIFGDGVIGRRPLNNSVVVLEYRLSNGELPNGARVFRNATTIDGESNVAIRTVTSATGGSVYESVESIKYNAPRAFTTQERAVTAEDYENLLKINYPEINAVTAYGGEDADPPQFGRVFVSVDLKDVDGLPDIKRREYARFLRNRATVAMEPLFVDPEYTYLNIISNVKYNINTTTLNPDDIRTLVISAMLRYSTTNLDKFATTFRYSRFVEAIDVADPSIVSNETEVEMVKYLTPRLNVDQKLTLKFNTKLKDITSPHPSEHPLTDYHTIHSSNFVYEGQVCNFEDEGNGVLRVVTATGTAHRVVVNNIGSIDYETGQMNITNLRITSYFNDFLKVYAVPETLDIQTTKNTILNILEPDISINIEQIRE